MRITLGLATGLSRVTTSCLWLGLSLSNSFSNSLRSTTKLSTRLTWVATSCLSLWVGLSITLRLSARLSGVSAASITLRFSTWLAWVTASCLCFAADDVGGLFVFDLEAVVVCLWVFLGLGDNGGKVSGETLSFEACSSGLAWVTASCFGLGNGITLSAWLAWVTTSCLWLTLCLSAWLAGVTASCLWCWDGITLSARLAWMAASCVSDWVGKCDGAD
jgi:hypothetical protein